MKPVSGSPGAEIQGVDLAEVDDEPEPLKGRRTMGGSLGLPAATELAAGLEAGWSERTKRADIDGILTLFADDAVFFASLPTMHVGHAGIRRYLEQVDMSGVVAITFQDRQVRVLADNVFTTTSFVLFDLMAGGKPVRLRYGISWTVARNGPDWKISQHHASPREEK